MKTTPLDSWIYRKIGASQPILSRQELEAWQLKKINETLALVRTKCSFYQKHFIGKLESILSLDELRKFPFTTEEDVRRNPMQFLCVSQDEINRVVTLQSSGTAGEPKRIYFTADDQELTIDFFGVGMSTLTKQGERVLILLPGEKPGSVGDLLHIGLQRIGAESIPYGPVRDPLHTLKVINGKQVDCLVGSPTQVLGLARRWIPGMRKPRTVLLSTDYVPSAIVEILEQVWQCRVYNHYGATEMGLGGGVECAAQRGYHLREADLYFEVINPLTGELVQDGDYGEVVFTTLTRTGMPLIRYRMGDRSRFLNGTCPCGTLLRTMEKVRGRFTGFVLIGDVELKLPDIDEVLFPIPGLLNFSVTVTGTVGQESVTIEAHMLSRDDARKLIEKALEEILNLKRIQVRIYCQQDPNEVGSIRKRVIIDRRE